MYMCVCVSGADSSNSGCVCKKEGGERETLPHLCVCYINKGE
jgi:hypothetical protein